MAGAANNLTEEKISDKCFELIFAFDEVFFFFQKEFRKLHLMQLLQGDHCRRIQRDNYFAANSNKYGDGES